MNLSNAAWVTFLFAAACSPQAQRADAPHRHEQTTSNPNVLDVSPSVQRNLGITFAIVEERNIEETIRVPGSFEAQPLARREYRMTLPARVELLVDEYESVTPGQVLYRFKSPDWPELLHEKIAADLAIESANAEIAVGRARATEAAAKLSILNERIEALRDSGFNNAELNASAEEWKATIPRLEAELGVATTKLENARKSREHAMHSLSAVASMSEEELEREVIVDGRAVMKYRTIDWIEVRATKPGVVEKLALTDGTFAEPPALVLSTIDPTRLRFRARALQADLSRLTDAVTAVIVPPQSPGRSVIERVEAEFQIGLEAQPIERTLTVLATPKSVAPWTRPGVSAFLEVVVAQTSQAGLAVPSSSIVRDGLSHVFFRRNPKDPTQVLRVEADLGMNDGRWVVVHSGLMRGDEVVVDGAYELKLASQQTGPSLEGAHVHADGTVHTNH